MKDIKEAHSDAVEYCLDFFDEDYLTQVLMENISDSLEFWGYFEDAIHDAADTPTQEEELTVMSREIKDEVVRRLEQQFKIVRK